MLCHFFLASVFSDEKLAINQIGILLSVMFLLPSCCQNLGLRSLIMVYLSMNFFGFILFDVNSALWICFSQIWEVFSHYFLEYFFLLHILSWLLPRLQLYEFSVFKKSFPGFRGPVHFLSVSFLCCSTEKTINFSSCSLVLFYVISSLLCGPSS